MGGVPVFDDYLALFQCRARHAYEGGDHMIFVGEIMSLDARQAAPLIFHGGRFAEMAQEFVFDTKAA
jgi:3-hydroxy-9,10-secoandrosta-1,3,5(10)-triene-9,17-dione monooxygenase reductase component